LQRVVGCIHAIVHHCDGGIVCAVRWINLSQYASCRLILGGGPRDILGSILFISGAKVSGLVADVTRRDRPVSPELALQAQIPLLHVGVVKTEGKIDVGSLLVERGILGRREWIWKRITAGHSLERIYKPAGRRGQSESIGPGRRKTESGIGEGFWLVKEDPIRTANALLALTSWIPSEADAGSKIVVAAVRVSLGDAFVAVEEDSRRGVGKHSGDCTGLKRREIDVITQVVLLGLWKGGFTADAAVDVEGLGELNIVLKVRGNVLTVGVTNLLTSIREGIEAAGEEVRESIFCQRTVEIEEAIGIVDVALIHLADNVLRAEAEVVFSLDPVSVIGPLILVPDEFCRSIGSATDGEVIRKCDVREVWRGIINVDANLRWARHVRRVRSVDRQTPIGEMDGVNDCWRNRHLIAEHDRLRAVEKTRTNQGKKIGCVDGWI